MAVANNADDYANSHLGIYFPASSNNTLSQGDLTGQCVSLIKWFLAEMTNVVNPQNARGNAKDYGDTLVAQGYAQQVGSPQRGDIVVWKSDGGGYGHIGVILSGDRVFEENVGLAGSPRAVFFGSTVYPSRIDPLSASWRKGGPIYYRVFSYVENIKQDKDMITKDLLTLVYQQNLGRDPSQIDYDGRVGKQTVSDAIYDVRNSQEFANRQQQLADQANTDAQASAQKDATIQTLTNENIELNSENNTLKSQIATQIDDTKNLNSAGLALQWLIKRLGLK